MTDIDRRQLLSGTAMLAGVAAVGTGTGIGSAAQAAVPAGHDPYPYEVTRSEAEWRALLGDDYAILRLGETEEPRSSAIWAEARQGDYHCRGCDLLQYISETKVNLLKGWLFFSSSEPNSQLMSQDWQTTADGEMAGSIFDARIEVHCRRCGSHMGHILLVEDNVLHCINGASLEFHAAET